jgi:L-cystine transport system permease protein
MGDFSFPFMFQTITVALGAIPRSLAIAFQAVGVGIVFGFPIALLRFFNVKFVARALKWMITIFKGIPIVLLFLVIYLILASGAGGTKVSSMMVAVIALSLPASIGMSDIFRGALESIDKSQFDAAFAIGHTNSAMFLRIILPQMVPVSLPMTGNVCIGMIKAVAVATIIGVADILNTALMEATINYRYLEAYFAAALIYWGVCILVERLFLHIERQFTYRRKATL